jgi:hypothetical protein
MNVRRTLSRRAWLMPVLLVVGLAAILPTIYLAGTVDPQRHLTDMPVGLVVEPQSGAAPRNVADGVAAAIEAGTGKTLAITRMTHDELATAMDHDRVAGAVVIPADFDTSIASLFPGASRSTVPIVTIVTNAGDGGLSSGLLTGNLTPVLRRVADGLGKQLLQDAARSELPAANAALLSQPFDTASRAYEPLPDHAGMGMSAFYFSLVLVLVAFIGASLTNPLVDSALGFMPSELGPLVARQPYTAVSRRRTFLAKVAILVTAAPLAALAIQLVAAAFGVTVGEPITLWLYSTAVIAAIGTSALAVFAVFGSGIGSLVNTLFFVARHGLLRRNGAHRSNTPVLPPVLRHLSLPARCRRHTFPLLLRRESRRRTRQRLDQPHRRRHARTRPGTGGDDPVRPSPRLQPPSGRDQVDDGAAPMSVA